MFLTVWSHLMMKGWWLDDVQDLILQEYTRLVAQPADVIPVDDVPIEVAQGPSASKISLAVHWVIGRSAAIRWSARESDHHTPQGRVAPLHKFKYSDSSNYNATLFYRKYESQFPLIARLARNFFSVPATSVPAESLFSIMGIIIDEQRNR